MALNLRSTPLRSTGSPLLPWLLTLAIGTLAGCGGGGTIAPAAPAGPSISALSPNTAIVGSAALTLTRERRQLYVRDERTLEQLHPHHYLCVDHAAHRADYRDRPRHHRDRPGHRFERQPAPPPPHRLPSRPCPTRCRRSPVCLQQPPWAGTAGVTLTLTGTNFISGSQLVVNGVARTATFVSATSLTAQLTAVDLAASGSLSIAVSNSAPGGGVSAALPFTVTNPPPTLTSINPASAIVGSGPLTVTFTGGGLHGQLGRAGQRSGTLDDGAFRYDAYRHHHCGGPRRDRHASARCQ